MKKLSLKIEFQLICVLIFAKSDNVKEIYQYICLKKKIKVDECKRTLLFNDEIQNEPKAVGLSDEAAWIFHGRVV